MKNDYALLNRTGYIFEARNGKGITVLYLNFSRHHSSHDDD